jgi:WD40 repeat protein
MELTLVDATGVMGLRTDRYVALAVARDLPAVFFVRVRRGVAHVVRLEPDGREQVVATQWLPYNSFVVALGVSDDGTRFALTTDAGSGGRGRLFVLREGRRRHEAFPSAYPSRTLDWLAGGRLLLGGDGSPALLVDADADVAREIFEDGYVVAASPDAERMALVDFRPSVRGDLHRCTLRRGERGTWAMLRAKRRAFCATFCAGGETVWALYSDPEGSRWLWCWDPESEASDRVAIATAPGAEAGQVIVTAATPGAVFVVGDERTYVRVAWDAEARRLSTRTVTSDRAVAPVSRWSRAASGGGRLVKFEGGAFRELDLESGVWRDCARRSDGVVYRLVPSRDGARVALVLDWQRIRVVDTASGAIVHDLEGHRGTIASLCWSPDGRTLYSVAEDGTLRTWDVAAGRELDCVPLSRDAFNIPECGPLWTSADGATLLVVARDHAHRYDTRARRWEQPLRLAPDGSYLHVVEGADADVDVLVMHDDPTGEQPTKELRAFDIRTGVLGDDRATDPHRFAGSSYRSCGGRGLFWHVWSNNGLLRVEGNDVTFKPFDPVRAESGEESFDADKASLGDRWIVAGSSLTERVALWDTATGALLATLDLPEFERTTGLLLLEERRLLFVGTSGGRLLRYRIDAP